MGDPHIDAMLIRWAGVKSYDEIGEITGIAPLEVARRTKDALAAVGVLEVHERRVKLMMTLESIIAEVDTRKEDASNRDLGGLLNASRAAAATILKELREIEKSNRADLDAVNRRHAQEMVRIVERAGERVIGALTERFPGVAADDIHAMLRQNILDISHEVDER